MRRTAWRTASGNVGHASTTAANSGDSRFKNAKQNAKTFSRSSQVVASSMDGTTTIRSTEPKATGSNPVGCTSQAHALHGLVSFSAESLIRSPSDFSQNFSNRVPSRSSTRLCDLAPKFFSAQSLIAKSKLGSNPCGQRIRLSFPRHGVAGLLNASALRPMISFSCKVCQNRRYIPERSELRHDFDVRRSAWLLGK